MEISDAYQRDFKIDHAFVGRDYELEWLHNYYFRGRRQREALIVSGAPGIGKTALIQQFLNTSRISAESLWIDVNRGGMPDENIDLFLARLYEHQPKGGFLVVVDGAESLSDGKLDHVISRVFNIKATSGLIFISRTTAHSKKLNTLNLDRLNSNDAEELIKRKFQGEIPSDAIELLVAQAQGNPVALNLIIRLLQNGDYSSVQRVLSGNIYDLSTKFTIPEPEIITSLKPQIISANDHLIEKLRRQPDSIYDLEPRKFEELLAQLLTDMGWDVELTKATRDGGKDMLAYLDTDLGRMLCLVEAKRYRKDRTVGVDLVRNLYGTLCDYQANSAMLITTSSFSQEAVNFRKRHEYQLQLRDYGDLLFWIDNYKNRAGII